MAPYARLQIISSLTRHFLRQPAPQFQDSASSSIFLESFNSDADFEIRSFVSQFLPHCLLYRHRHHHQHYVPALVADLRTFALERTKDDDISSVLTFCATLASLSISHHHHHDSSAHVEVDIVLALLQISTHNTVTKRVAVYCLQRICRDRCIAVPAVKDLTAIYFPFLIIQWMATSNVMGMDMDMDWLRRFPFELCGTSFEKLSSAHRHHHHRALMLAIALTPEFDFRTHLCDMVVDLMATALSVGYDFSNAAHHHESPQSDSEHVLSVFGTLLQKHVASRKLLHHAKGTFLSIIRTMFGLAYEINRS